jgi:lactoylglutathione lyase
MDKKDKQETREEALKELTCVRLGLEVETPAGVDTLTARLRGDGFPVLDGPRTTGDGYYESIVADPEGNRIVLTAAPA